MYSSRVFKINKILFYAVFLIALIISNLYRYNYMDMSVESVAMTIERIGWIFVYILCVPLLILSVVLQIRNRPAIDADSKKEILFKSVVLLLALIFGFFGNVNRFAMLFLLLACFAWISDFRIITRMSLVYLIFVILLAPVLMRLGLADSIKKMILPSRMIGRSAGMSNGNLLSFMAICVILLFWLQLKEKFKHPILFTVLLVLTNAGIFLYTACRTTLFCMAFFLAIYWILYFHQTHGFPKFIRKPAKVVFIFLPMILMMLTLILSFICSNSSTSTFSMRFNDLFQALNLRGITLFGVESFEGLHLDNQYAAWLCLNGIIPTFLFLTLLTLSNRKAAKLHDYPFIAFACVIEAFALMERIHTTTVFFVILLYLFAKSNITLSDAHIEKATSDTVVQS